PEGAAAAEAGRGEQAIPEAAAAEAGRGEQAIPEAAAAEAGPDEQAPSHADGSVPDIAPVQDFISVPLVGPQADSDVPRRNPLPLGAEPPDQKDLGISERPPPIVM